MSQDENQHVEETQNLIQEVSDVVESIEDNDMKEKLGKLLETTKSSLAQKSHNAKKRKEAEDALETMKIEFEEYKTNTKPKEDDPEPTVTKKESTVPDDYDEVKNTVSSLKEESTKRGVGYELNLSPKETDFLFASAKGLGISPQEAFKNTAVKAGIDALKSEGRADDNTPTPSGSSSLKTDKSFKEMKRSDRKKAWESKA